MLKILDEDVVFHSLAVLEDWFVVASPRCSFRLSNK